MARFCCTCGASNPTTQIRGKEKGKGVAARRGLKGGSEVSRSKQFCSWPLERRELCERLKAQYKAAGRRTGSGCQA